MGRIILFVLLLLTCGCTRTVEIQVPVCPFLFYLTENDRQVISDMLVDEILAHNIYFEKIGKSDEVQ